MTTGSIIRTTACLLCLLGLQALALAADAPNRVLVQGFENGAPQAKVWVVNIPEENASLELSSEQTQQGEKSLEVHYQFSGPGQYLGGAIGSDSTIGTAAAVNLTHSRIRSDGIVLPSDSYRLL